MNTVKIDKYFRGMIAHRGLSGIETENTINAFIAAANRSYFGIECDVQAAKDGKLIITHDDTLLRLGLLNIHIPSYTYDEIKRFTLIDRKTGNLNDKIVIPLFSDYLCVCHTYQKHAVIELKEGLSLANIDNCIELIDKEYDQNDVSIISFNDKYLSYVRKNHPKINLYYLTNKMDDKVYDLCEKNQFNLDVLASEINEADVKKFHLVGLKVCVYTVNDKEQAEKLIKMGVDYITTDILE
ncbi:MAG: glycerophosphodiester phosphodiesterase family protein [Candidatus Izemoplasmatales bacterium]|nr:glycerophosphodiester phosphodiesterase family protein [Candidatus Izemoplasmatales bacterium]